VPSTLCDANDFVLEVGRKIKAAKGQLKADGKQVHILAVDFTASTGYQRLLSPVPFEDAAATLAWVRQALQPQNPTLVADAVLCFCISLDRPELAVLRFLPLQDDLPSPF
jgi:hypothetical protein